MRLTLLLAPGVLLGVPGLPVVVMNAISGALVFALARRYAGGVVAVLTWLIWSTSFPVQYFHAMYLSEVPSSLAWLLAWWGVSRWATSGRARDLAIVYTPPEQPDADHGRRPRKSDSVQFWKYLLWAGGFRGPQMGFSQVEFR